MRLMASEELPTGVTAKLLARCLNRTYERTQSVPPIPHISEEYAFLVSPVSYFSAHTYNINRDVLFCTLAHNINLKHPHHATQFLSTQYIQGSADATKTQPLPSVSFWSTEGRLSPVFVHANIY